MSQLVTTSTAHPSTAEVGPEQRSVLVKQLPQLYLSFAGIALLIFALASANGIERRGAVMSNLATARVGFYYQADATKKLFTGEFVDESVSISGVTHLDKIVNAFLEGKLRVKQREPCVLQDYAKNCNLPIFDLPLGMVLAFSAALLVLAMINLAFMNPLKKILLISSISSMATLIFLAGIAFGTSINDSPIRNLQVARVGLYVQQDVFQEQGGRLTFARPASARPKGSFWFGNSDPKRIILNDGSVLLEMPFLSAVGFSFLLLLGLAAGGYFIEYQSTRLPE